MRNELLKVTDALLDGRGGVSAPTAKQVKDAHERSDLQALWHRVRELKMEHEANRIAWDTVAAAIEEFFAWEKYWGRRDVLKQCPTEELLLKKRELLDCLRLHGVCVLEKGTIEDYYPEGITGDNKPARAQCFCNNVTTKEQVLELCSSYYKCTSGKSTSEFEAIFHTIFN